MLAKFTSIIRKSPARGGWSYVIWPESAAFFETRARVKVLASANGQELATSFMPLGDGNHKLPLTGALLRSIGKAPGDDIEIVVLERI